MSGKKIEGFCIPRAANEQVMFYIEIDTPIISAFYWILMSLTTVVVYVYGRGKKKAARHYESEWSDKCAR